MRGKSIVLGFAFASLLPAATAAAATHTDEDLGYSIQVPQGWTSIPIASEEKYIVAKFLSDREYVDKKEGWPMKPELKVILFDPKGKATGTVEKEADEDGNSFRLKINNPYKSFKDYLKVDGEGGRYISKEDSIKVNGVDTTWYEVKFEKLTLARRGIAFVYHASDIDYCATTEVLEQHWDKLSPGLINTLKSFRIIPRKGVVKRETTGGAVTVPTDTSKLPPEERAKLKLEKFERQLKVVESKLPDGWSMKRSKSFVAFTNVDDKFTSRILEQAEAVRAWADANCSWFGEGVPLPQIIRICKTRDEENSFRSTSGRSEGTGEITVSKESASTDFAYLSEHVFLRWMKDKNSRIAWSMPPWLRNGLTAWVKSGTSKGGKLEFSADGELVQCLRLASRQKTLIPAKEMFLMTMEEMYTRSEADFRSPRGTITAGPYKQASGLVRYLLAGPGKSGAKTKDLLKAYVTALDERVKEGDSSKPEMMTEATTEEEEDEQFKKRESSYKEREKELLQSVLDKTFVGWTDADWSAFEKSYAAFAK